MPPAVPTKARSDTNRAHRPRRLNKVVVDYGDGVRRITCFCGAEVTRSIVPHFKAAHADDWRNWIATFIELRGDGWPLKRIMRLFKAGSGQLLFSWTVVEREIRKAVEAGGVKYAPPPTTTVSRWEPDDFELEKTTLWDFPERGSWAVHQGDYRGNWPPQIPRNLIERFTMAGDLVVDPFAGGGTTLIEAWLLGRRSFGLDLSLLAVQTCEARFAEMEAFSSRDNRVALDPKCKPTIVHGDAMQLGNVLRRHGICPGQAKLACAHPPYLDSLKYTGDHAADLSGIADPNVFIGKMRVFAQQMNIVLADDGVLAVLIGDVPKRGRTVHLAQALIPALLAHGFSLDHVIIKKQHRDRSSEFYYGRNGDGFLMAHEYLLILHRAKVKGR